MDTSILRENIQSLVEKFERDKYHYLSKDYLEAQTRQDFIDPLFEALGWDISNKAGLPPFEREVLLEKGETSGRPDYNFRLGGASKFFVEAKAPPESLDSVGHVLQAKSYAWNTKEVFIAVLTDFEGLKVFDASLTPDRKNPLQGLIIDLKYTEYLNNLDKLLLLSKEAVSQGSLERLLLRDAKSKRQRIPVDKKFLQDMGLWREGLAKDVYRHDPTISVRTLNEVVQRLLDRIVFIRIAEDRKIIEPRTLFEIAQLWKAEGKKRPIQYHLNNLFREINADLNGDIFKSPHPCEQYGIDSALLSEIIEDLYFPNSPYLFDVIGVELLGSIYERYLGNTIRVTPGGRVKVEEKPEVRKAGGVYYTPQYIVKYIVENTVGKLIEGKTPKQIEKIKVLDPACGSGSFLLGAYQYLIDYHIKYYREHPKEAHVHPLFPDLIGDQEGKGDPPGRPYRLSIIKKGHILRNNLFGVDIDPQAVEITMMSLYLKALEGERTLPRKQGLLPVLSDNIKCGNSLIGYDIFEPVGATRRVAPTKGQGILVGAGLPRPHITDEERERINPFDWDSRSAGFGEIMGRGGFDCVIGNPPWGGLVETTHRAYFERNYASVTRELETHLFFVEKGVTLLSDVGMLSYILPNTLMYVKTSEPLRKLLLTKYHINELTELGKYVFDDAPDIVPVIINLSKAFKSGKTKKRFTLARSFSDETSKIDPAFLSERPFSKIKQTVWMEAEDCVLNLFLTEEVIPILAKIRKDCTSLGEVASISYGIKTGNNEKFLSNTKVSESFKKALKTKEIERYSIKWAGLYLNYSLKLAGYRSQSLEVPKIIVQYIRKLSLKRRLICGLDAKGEFYPLNNYSYIEAKDSDLRYILGIINSSLMNFYFKTNFIDYNIKPYYLSQLPIKRKKLDALYDKLIILVDRILELHRKKHALPASSQREAVEREIAVTDEKIDDLVYELYGITKGEREIIEEST